MNWFGRKSPFPEAAQALPGRDDPMPIPERHRVLDAPLRGPFPSGYERAMFAMGCFWGAEELFWKTPGVYTTAVGYAGGATPNPNYKEVCSGATGHSEVVLVVFDPASVGYDALLRAFWESHDPTQGMRQGNDTGTQYRSGIFVFNPVQNEAAIASRDRFQQQLHERGFGAITTEIVDAPEFYYAEDYHQQYLARNPQGYCGLAPTGACLGDTRSA